jgi:hypothetical protein
LGDFSIMGDQDDGRGLLGSPGNPLGQQAPHARIEPLLGFVQDKQLEGPDERLGQEQFAALS